jgi:hypothetical protein
MGADTLAHPAYHRLRSIKIAGALVINVGEETGDGYGKGIKNPVGPHSWLSPSGKARFHNPAPGGVEIVGVVTQELLEQRLGRQG